MPNNFFLQYVHFGRSLKFQLSRGRASKAPLGNAGFPKIQNYHLSHFLCSILVELPWAADSWKSQRWDWTCRTVIGSRVIFHLESAQRVIHVAETWIWRNVLLMTVSYKDSVSIICTSNLFLSTSHMWTNISDCWVLKDDRWFQWRFHGKILLVSDKIRSCDLSTNAGLLLFHLCRQPVTELEMLANAWAAWGDNRLK